MDWNDLVIEQARSDEGVCDCCGTTTRRVRGLVSSAEGTVAAYLVAWTLGRPEHGAFFDLIIGKWESETTAGDRAVVSLEYRVAEEGAAFMVVDRADGAAGFAELAEHALKRDEVIGTPLAQQVFALVDAIYMKDPRVAELQDWG